MISFILCIPWVGPPLIADAATNGEITVDSLNFRSEPSTTGPIIDQLQKGTTVEILSEPNQYNWVNISYNGQNGWVSGIYVQKDTGHSDKVETENVQTFGNTELVILHNGTNIRKNPNTLSSILDRANKNDRFQVVQFVNDWYEIVLRNGETGYVASWLVSIEDTTTEVVDIGTEDYLKGKRIVIDPGHGGLDNGTTGIGGTLEKNLTLKTANALFQKLKVAGAEVVMTRLQDKYLTLPTRVNMADYYNADAFISIHYDSFHDPQIRGLTTYFYHPWQKELAIDIHTSLIKNTKLNDRGVNFGDYYVIRENDKNAILVELGYLSNATEEQVVNSNQYQELAATGIYEGLYLYFKDRNID